MSVKSIKVKYFEMLKTVFNGTLMEKKLLNIKNDTFFWIACDKITKKETVLMQKEKFKFNTYFYLKTIFCL